MLCMELKITNFVCLFLRQINTKMNKTLTILLITALIVELAMAMWFKNKGNPPHELEYIHGRICSSCLAEAKNALQMTLDDALKLCEKHCPPTFVKRMKIVLENPWYDDDGS